MEPTPRNLFMAAAKGDERVVRALIERGADVATPCGEEGTTPLYVACATGQAGMVQLLLDSKANPDLGLKGGRSPLAATCESDRRDIARLLLEHGAALDTATVAGTTALMVACHRGHGALIRLLLDSGASTSERKPGCGTPLIQVPSLYLPCTFPVPSLYPAAARLSPRRRRRATPTASAC